MRNKYAVGCLAALAAALGDGAMADCFEIPPTPTDESLQWITAGGAGLERAPQVDAPKVKEGKLLEVVITRRGQPKRAGLGRFEGKDGFVWNGTALRTLPDGREAQVEVVYFKAMQPTQRGARAALRMDLRYARKFHGWMSGCTLARYIGRMEPDDSDYATGPGSDREDFHADG